MLAFMIFVYFILFVIIFYTYYKVIINDFKDAKKVFLKNKGMKSKGESFFEAIDELFQIFVATSLLILIIWVLIYLFFSGILPEIY